MSIDFDNMPMLDFIGESIKALGVDTTPNLVSLAYDFIADQEQEFIKSGNDKLRDRYSKLRKYFESRLSLWGIEPLH